MKITTTILFLLTIWTSSYGQDGSDIRYFKVKRVDSTLIGKDVHFDFFNRSFHGRDMDTIIINIDNKPIKFVEVRKDNGYNNWFSEQSLKSIETIDGLTFVITKLKLNRITSSSFQVTMYVDNYDSDKRLLPEKSRQIEYWFDKKDITEILVKSK